MISKTTFLEAMTFFDEYDKLRSTFTADLSKYFDGHGILFTGADTLFDKYLNLLVDALELEKYPNNYGFDNDLSYWLFECNDTIYAPKTPDSDLLMPIGKAPCKFWDVEVNGKKFHIENNSQLYDFFEYCYNIKHKKQKEI